MIEKNNIVKNKKLNRLTWFGVGGTSKIYFQPETEEDLISFLKKNKSNLNIYPLGAGSNIVIRDKGYNGIIIHFNKLNKISIDNKGTITSYCGAMDAEVARFARNNARSGLEFLIGIPGTIGGGIRMNSGAYGSEIKNFLINVIAVNKKGILKTFTVEELGLNYRSNSLSQEWMFLKANFRSNKGSINRIQDKMKEIIKSRKDSQPTGLKTGGSTFMNGKDFKAWELIDNAGCRGLKVGGAVISEKHCNFIINENYASATDIENLGELVRDKVFKKTGRKLNWEIKIIGEK
ncbi:MAG: UDP-N-acetylenolpyruvoylglucosamine reductase [SAR116 cluster bacterium]|nr:UDP-N-acetylenolpyruvoylglucosamine reductase [SAR116 cluster bacterium]RPH11097.1 MAG: UDP-N-acetylmuramate dehydrogenase [Alphaproteobacteria bacterium TMED54]